MNVKYNYLIGSADTIAKNYDIKNRPDPDENGCKKLYDDIIETYFSNGVISKYTIKNWRQQFKYDGKGNWEQLWENYEKLNNEDPELRVKNLKPPFYTISVKSENEEWLLSADYIGPSINWALEEVKLGTLSNDDIIEILNVCRTIGGHIVWPRGRHLIHKINPSRGGEESVYDRIDWTLFLVKICYINDFEEAEIQKIILERYQREIYFRVVELISAICETKSWFKEIGSFVDFCNQFILIGSFVNEKYEINWFAKQFPVFPENYKQFSINNTQAIQRRNEFIGRIKNKV